MTILTCVNGGLKCEMFLLMLVGKRKNRNEKKGGKKAKDNYSPVEKALLHCPSLGVFSSRG